MRKYIIRDLGSLVLLFLRAILNNYNPIHKRYDIIFDMTNNASQIFHVFNESACYLRKKCAQD